MGFKLSKKDYSDDKDFVIEMKAMRILLQTRQVQILSQLAKNDKQGLPAGEIQSRIQFTNINSELEALLKERYITEENNTYTITEMGKKVFERIRLALRQTPELLKSD